MNNPSETLLKVMHQGEKLSYEVNTLISLNQEDCTWFVEKGSVDLFYIEDAEGKRTFIASFTAGEILFNMGEVPDESVGGLFIIVYAETIIRQLVFTDIKALALTGIEDKKSLVYWLEIWAERLQQPLLRDDTDEAVECFLEHDGVIDLKKADSATYFPSHGYKSLLWLELTEGAFSFENKVFTHFEGPFPLIPQLTILAVEVLKGRLIETKHLLDSDGFWDKLAVYHHHWHQLFAQQRELRDTLAAERIHRIKTLEEKVLADSLEQLSEVLSLSTYTQRSISSEHPLLNAMQSIASASGFHFSFPEKLPLDGNFEVQLKEICIHSQIRFRKVTLPKAVHRKDHGHFLAFKGKEQIPVGLSNANGKKYTYFDPSDHCVKEVTDDFVKELDEQAYTFYSPLPEPPKSSALLRFGFRGLKGDLFALLLVSILAATLNLYTPFAIGWIFSLAVPFQEELLLTQITLGFLAVAIGQALFGVSHALTVIRLESIVAKRLQGGMWDRLMRLPLSFFQKFTAGDLYQRVAGVDQIRQLFSGTNISTVITGLFSVLYIIVMFYHSWQLAILGMIPVFIMVIVDVIGTSIAIKLDTKGKNLEGRIYAFLVQTFSSISKVRVAKAENRVFGIWARMFAEKKHLDLNVQFIHSIMLVVREAMSSFSTIFIYFIMIYLSQNAILHHESLPVTLGSYLAFYSAYGAFTASFYSMALTLFSTLGISIPLWRRSRPILDEEPEVGFEKVPAKEIKGNISINKLSFSYKPDQEPILSEINLKIEQGEFVAFVGHSGCGKSTLIRLLLGIEKPSQGQIFYDQQDLANVNLVQIRRQIGLVLQNGGIIDGTIRDNISCGRLLSTDEINQAIELSSFSEDMENLPMGLETILQNGGGTLSGGQRQRLLIARALVSCPKILIFDEATSALDNKTQEAIRKNIDSLKITRLVIAHRLSTIKNADCIYVLADRKIQDSGTFKELAERPGLFAELVKKQGL